jgi:putative transposase
MADTYTKLFIHVVFAVKGRENLISPRWKDDLYKYINGIIVNSDQKLMIINGMPDHIHILLGVKPTIVFSDLIRDIKANSSQFINEKIRFGKI